MLRIMKEYTENIGDKSDDHQKEHRKLKMDYKFFRLNDEYIDDEHEKRKEKFLFVWNKFIYQIKISCYF